MKNDIERDRSAIDQLTNLFFDLFTNTNGQTPKVRNLEKLFIKEGILINNTTGKPMIYGLQEFIEPRERILTDGTLTDFHESEVSHKTEVFENIAQRICNYKKSGKNLGVSFKSKGVKTIQYIRINSVWKIASVLWNDEEG